jgi:hypothetical protein
LTDQLLRRAETAVRAHYGDSSGVQHARETPIDGTYMVYTNEGLYLIGGMKQCTGCWEWKPQLEFAISNRANDGLQHKCKACNSKYHYDNKEHRDAYFAEYRRLYPDKRKAASDHGKHNRRARRRHASGTITKADIDAIRASQTDKRGRLICWRCNKPITGTPHLDHWIPLALGGTNGPGNLHYMHGLCNMSKGAKHPTEIGRLI